MKNQKKKILAFDYLRAFVVMLVVLHHALMAYHSLLYYFKTDLVAKTIPVTNLLNPIFDEAKWSGFNTIIKLNDSFFMSLLFFISGFFIWGSLKRKGVKLFLYERFKRLGVPFVMGVITIVPLAYYPAHLQWGLSDGIVVNYFEFWLEFVKSGFPLGGPLWFLWVLLGFNCVAVFVFKSRLEAKVKSWKIFSRPILFFVVLVAISALVWIPCEILLGSVWKGIGPFSFQVDRLLHYFAYFFVGALVGRCGLEKTIFQKERQLSSQWWLWLLVGLGFVFYFDFFPIACAALSFAMIGFFLRYTNRNIALMDSLAENAFGIYIFHYIFTAWIQFLLLEIEISAILKGMIVFAGAMILSWGLTAWLRKIAVLRMII